MERVAGHDFTGKAFVLAKESTMQEILQAIQSGGGGGISPPIATTYADLVTLLSSNSAVIGQEYVFTYTNKNNLYRGDTSGTTVYTGIPEAIVVRASAVNKLSPFARSLTFPEDVLIYTITSPGNTWIGDTGFITYRESTLQDIIFPYDFRNTVWRLHEQESGNGFYVTNSDNGNPYIDYPALQNIDYAAGIHVAADTYSNDRIIPPYIQRAYGPCVVLDTTVGEINKVEIGQAGNQYVIHSAGSISHVDIGMCANLNYNGNDCNWLSLGNGSDITFNSIGQNLNQAVFPASFSLVMQYANSKFDSDRGFLYLTYAELLTIGGPQLPEFLFQVSDQQEVILNPDRTQRGGNAETIVITGLTTIVPAAFLTNVYDLSSTNSEETILSLTPPIFGQDYPVKLAPMIGLTVQFQGTALPDINADGQFLWEGAIEVSGDYRNYLPVEQVAITNSNGNFVVYRQAR